MSVLSRLRKFAAAMSKRLASMEMPSFDETDVPAERSVPETPETYESSLGEQYDIHVLPSLPEGFPTPEELNVTYVGTNPMIAPCPHPDAPRVFSLVVRGLPINGLFSLTVRCAECTRKLFERASLDCAKCGKAITPHLLVAVAWRGAKEPFTHIDCAEDRDLLCGALMFGRLLTLHEISDNFQESVPADRPTVAYHRNQEHFRNAAASEETRDEASEASGDRPTDPDGAANGPKKPDIN